MSPIFTSKFNQFEQISATKAWSLFFTFSQGEHLLGSESKTGRYLTVGLLSVAIASILEIAIFAG